MLLTARSKKWVLGISIILAAVAGALVAFFDNDPTTEPNIPQVIEEVQEGVSVITSEKE